MENRNQIISNLMAVLSLTMSIVGCVAKSHPDGAAFDIRAGWGRPMRLAQDPGGTDEPMSPLAMDDEGGVVAVWLESRERKTLFARTYSPRRGWGQAVPIDGEYGEASEPRVAMDSKNGLTVFWVNLNGTKVSLYRNFYHPSAGWGAAAQVGESAGSLHDLPLIDRSGNLLFLWGESGEQNGLGAPRAGQATDLANITKKALGTQFEMHPSGNFTAVWYQSDPMNEGTEYHIWSIRYRMDSGLYDREMVSAAGADAIDPRLAISGNGDSVVVWRQFDGQHYRLFASRHRFDGIWEKPIALETHDEEAVYPEVSMDDKGNAMVVWVQHRCDTSRRCDDSHVWAIRLDSTTGWGKATRIAADAWDPQIAMDRLGNVIVIGTRRGWLMKRSTIWVRRYHVGVGWEEPMRVETNLANAGHPKIAINARGQAVVSWEQYRLGHRTLWVNLYQP